MAQVVWSREALFHLDLIAAYIDQFNPEAGQRFARRLFEAGESLQQFPHRGHPDGGGGRVLAIVRPYLIRYRIADDTVLILDIRHGRRGAP
ncbi:MAG TPA: type II toxin-antitoxin system RelE/ParE family toxin [Croceibacterium sp.]|nr:type II toxin-antitoxin system RelE/ParE family toxin [Croceibacterium sp.]